MQHEKIQIQNINNYPCLSTLKKLPHHSGIKKETLIQESGGVTPFNPLLIQRLLLPL